MQSTQSQRIKMLIDHFEESSYAFAKRTGYSQTAVRNWVAGTHPPERTINQIAEKTGCSPHWLADGVGEMFPSGGAEVTTPEKVLQGTKAPSMLDMMQTMVKMLERLENDNRELRGLLLKLSGNRLPNMLPGMFRLPKAA